MVVELRSHSWFSFGAGVSSPRALAQRAALLELPALGLADAGNLCGALEFAQAGAEFGVAPLFGVELRIRKGARAGPAVLLAESGAGYANICRLTSLAHLAGGRREPELDFRFLESHAAGVVALLAGLVDAGRRAEAKASVAAWLGCLGRRAVFLELQQHLAYGDTRRNRILAELAERCGAGLVASNAPYYLDAPEARLHDVLTANRLNQSLDAARNRLKPNGHWHLKSAPELRELFRDHPESLLNTAAIVEQCGDFRLPEYLQGRYAFPMAPTPPGYSQQAWLERICRDAAERRYGRLRPDVVARLEQEFALIRRHGLAGFFLTYHRIVELARDCVLELGRGDAEKPLGLLSPGRGRGSSVSMLVGYLVGLSHVDPLEYGLSLDRFLSEDTEAFPDIDLDFPRDVRERVIEEWGWDHAALACQFPVYKARGTVRALGRALGLPADAVGLVARSLDSNRVADLPRSAEYARRSGRPGWRDLFALAPGLAGIPRGIAQHPGGMLVSAGALTDLAPDS